MHIVCCKCNQKNGKEHFRHSFFRQNDIKWRRLRLSICRGGFETCPYNTPQIFRLFCTKTAADHSRLLCCIMHSLVREGGNSLAVCGWVGRYTQRPYTCAPHPTARLATTSASPASLANDNGLVLGGHANRTHRPSIVAVEVVHVVTVRIEVEVPRVVRAARVERT